MSESLITGYQYGLNKHYIGEYRFPNNLDKEEIHVPPNTVLVAPPDNIQEGKDAMWDGSGWVIVDKVAL